ncbi:uncharacterized protein LOC124131961 [Haliotis rufescens]|uniref:uncharacterized protein LOC124131961 n=1 Tax=Haliotis rufescens TaxID=6454 RepID=UPI00201F4C1E|nr:uncharacterized protein LOC124131961 [Haliotis rufescens]XP_046351461.2 uncharacterized protein LOC124131961 [Haliotis rufescens]
MSAKSRRKVISCEALQYECGICLREFSTSWCLQLHIRTHSEQKSFDCHECGMTYPDFSALCEHLKVHIFGADPVEQDADSPSISCHQDPVSLTDGNQVSHGFKPQLTCATCEKRFGSFKALKLHSRIHKTKKPVQTQEPWNLSTGETSRTFGSEGNQEDNKKEGTQNVKSKRGRKRRNGNLELTGYFLKIGKKYRCEVCAKKLSSRSFMEKHILKHQRDQFHCSHCDKFFTTYTDLKDHEKLHETAGEPTIPHKIVVDDHVKAAELVVADLKGFSCIVCKKTFDSKQKAHVHILCHKNRKGRRKLNRSKPGSQSSISSDASLNRQDVSDMEVKAGVSAGPSHMTAGSADTTQSLCCEECKEEFSTQDELVHHQNLHIRDHTMALMRILKPGTNLDVSIVETQTLVDAVHSVTDVLTATNKEALFRNTSRQELASSGAAPSKEALFRNTSRQELASSGVAINKEALFGNTSRQELISSGAATNKEALFRNTSRQGLASSGVATNKEALFRNTSRQGLASSGVAINKEALFGNTSRQELASSGATPSKEALFRNTSRQELASSGAAINKEALFGNTSRQKLISSGAATNKEALFSNTSRQGLASSGVATNKEALFRNTSRQKLASSGVHHPESSPPDVAALESSSQRNLLKAFPNVQCNVKVVLKRLEDENLLCQNGVDTVFRHSEDHSNERDDHTQQRKSGEVTETETLYGTGECHQTKGTLSDNSKALQEGGDFSGDNGEYDDTFHYEDDIKHAENDHYSVSATDSSDLMSSEHAQDVSTAKDDSDMMSAENVHDSASTKELVSPEAHSNGNTAKLSSLAKSILKNVAEKGDKFSCKICEVEFSELQKAKNHVRIHVAKKRFECKFCPAKFVYASKLLSHQATHAPENLSPKKKTRVTTRCHYENVGKEFICNICDKPFKTKHKVQCHVRYHLLEDTYQCRFCQRCFRKKYSLHNHEKTHSDASGEGSKTTFKDDGKTEDEETEKVTLKFKRGKYKEFTEAVNDVLKCKLCESTFRNNKQIIDHFRSHFAERKFWCTICSAAFKRNSHLEVHMKAHDRGNVKGQKISMSEGVQGAMNVEKKSNVKMIKENNSKDGANVVDLSADTSIATDSIKDRGGEAGGCVQPELPSGDTCLLESVTIPVQTNHEQMSVATLSQEDRIRNDVIGEKSSTTEALTNSSLNQHPISTAAEMVKHHPLTDPDGAAFTCRSSGEEGHLLVGHAKTTVTSAEGTNDKEPLSNTKREIRDHSSAMTVDLSDEEDGAGEQKDTTCAAPAAVAACAKDCAETQTKAKTEPSADFITVHGLRGSKNANEIGDDKMLMAASDEDGGGLVDDVSDDNDLDSDFKYEPDMDYDSDISNEDLSSARNRRPPIKYLYDASASCTDGCSAGEGETKDANINKSSGSENDDGPSRNKHDVQITFCNPKKKTSKSTNKPSRKGITVASGSKGQGRQVITQMNTGEKVTQHVGQLEKLEMETISSQGQDVGGLHHEDEAQDCPVGLNTTDTEEECALMDTTSSDCQYSPQKHQTEYTIEAGGSFRCVFCDKVFKSLLNIRSHLSIEHDLFRCKVCIATFQTHQELKKHNEENKHLQFRVLSNRNISTKIEIVGEMFKCNLCNKMFSDKGKCALHVRHHLTAFKYICDICSQACKSRSVLAAHMSIHNNSCSFECKACFNMYPNMGSLRYHEKRHTEEDKINILNYVKCDTCGDLCVNEKMLEKHVLQHKDSHTCDFCKMSFQTYTALQNHQSVEQHHKCEYCGKTYKDQKYLRKHIRTVHTKQEAHMCDKCGKSLSSQAGLRAHMALHTGTAKFQCSMCNLKFHHAGKLEHHMKAHEAGGGLCELCKKFFRTRICLKVHKLMHQALEAAGEDLGNTKGLLIQGLSEYTCPCCKKTVGTVEQLRQHIKHHFVERRFKCTMCDMSFFNNYYLETHIRIHNKDFSFHCDQCPRKFASSNFLNNHIKKIHLKSDRGRFPCDICKKIFRTRAGVGSHKRLHKDRVRGHPCDLCELSFFSPSELKAHKQTHSSVRAFMCDLCGVSYKTKYMLRNHMLRHEGRKDFKCDLCGKEFFLKAYLQIHLRNHKNERNFRCNICDKGFNHPNSLNDHKRIHTGEKPYKCKTCDRKFTDRSARRTHELSHKASTSKSKGKVDL